VIHITEIRYNQQNEIFKLNIKLKLATNKWWI